MFIESDGLIAEVADVLLLRSTMITLDLWLKRKLKAVCGPKGKTASELCRRRGARALVGAILLVGGLLPSPAIAQHVPAHQKFDAALDEAVDTPDLGGPAVVRRVIVRARPGASTLIRNALIASGHKIKSELNLIDGLAVDLSKADLEALARNPQVVSLSSDAEVRATAVPATVASASSAGLLRTTLGLTALSPQGLGVGVAVIDSGISPSPEFDSRITAFYDFTRGGVATAPFDEYGHGTHVAGLIGGNGAQASQYQGVAPSVRLIGLKVLDTNGMGK